MNQKPLNIVLPVLLWPKLLI